jgi:dipeptidase E
MKLLLTSAGIKNKSIHAALLELLGKPIADCNALCITTASYAHPMAGPGRAWSFITGKGSTTPMTELGWNSLGVLELTALPSLNRDLWVSWLRQANVLLVNGGGVMYLCHRMQQSGLAELLPSLEIVWVGLSAGSMVMTPRVGAEFIEAQPSITGDDKTLGFVDFSIFPHLDNPDLPSNTMIAAERWAANIAGPAYAIDDETAFKVVDGVVEVISEGHWKRFTPRDELDDSA